MRLRKSRHSGCQDCSRNTCPSIRVITSWMARTHRFAMQVMRRLLGLISLIGSLICASSQHLLPSACFLPSHAQPPSERFSHAWTSGEFVHGFRPGCNCHTPAATVRRAADARFNPVASESKKTWSWNLLIWCAIVTSLYLRGGTDGVVWSAVLGAFKLRRWMRRGPVSIERGTMAHFAWRGATIGVVLSVLLELGMPLAVACFWPGLAIFLMRTGAVAAVEELGKFMALTWLSWSSMKPWCRNPSPSKSWPRSPRGIMLAGFSVGAGFMVVENSGYFPMALDSFMAAIWRCSNREDVMLEVVLEFLEFLCFRIILNPHPYLTGIVAGRFAKGQTANAKQQYSTAVLWKVLWPSAVLHALLNLFADVPVLRSILVLICGKVFRDTWESLAEPDVSSSAQQQRE